LTDDGVRGNVTPSCQQTAQRIIAHFIFTVSDNWHMQ